VNLLLFGASGTLGSACKARCKQLGWTISEGNRQIDSNFYDTSFDAVVWAQGSNLTKSFEETSDDDWIDILNSNLLFVVQTLRNLLRLNQVANGARLVVIGSVWERVHRSNKSAYVTSKAALAGLVRALASDLGDRGISINCVSPGVVMSSMTMQHLSSEQIAQIERETPSSQLVTPLDVANVVSFLISKNSSGINGQSIFVDNGWSGCRSV